jgi:class 3 adenylate cyclase
VKLKPFEYHGYLFSFFFWLDIIAIVSMLPDIRWIADGLGIGDVSNSVSGTNSNFSKAGRVVRTVRLVRLVRVYKITAERRRLKKIDYELTTLFEEGAITYEQWQIQKDVIKQNKQSKVGAELSDTTTRRVIIIVLAMLCLIPVLNYNENDLTQSFGSKLLHEFNLNGDDNGRKVILDEYLKEFSRYYNNWYTIRLVMSPFKTGNILYHPGTLDSIRSSAITKFHYISTRDSVVYETIVWFNNYATQYNTAVDGILLILFVTAVMLVGTIVFTADAQALVLDPIERMMTMVDDVAKDPLKPLHFEFHEGSGEYETRLLGSTIEKITGLLRIGFGEAGARIISENLKAESGSKINPLIPGSRVYAIFGFCDIHHFEEVNEKIGREIMSFVNSIAAIVHGKVNSWAGQSNKNLGNAFLVVWRIGDEKTLLEQLEGNDMIDKRSPSKKKTKAVKAKKEVDLTRVPGVDSLADKAVIGYLKIIAEINRSADVLAYRHDKRLIDEDGHEFKVRMGFGLHAGWAIEGAVGSLKKVDATYLSPHVNMAARLETSSKQYGVPLLLSERLYELMSATARKKCRRLDVVTVKGSEVPIGIYTYDCLQDQIFPSRHKKHATPVQIPRESAKDNVVDISSSASHVSLAQNDIPKVIFMNSSAESADVFEQDADMLALRKHITAEFETTFQQAVDLYIGGDWPSAKPLFERADSIMKMQAPSLGGDGPSRTLLKYIAAHQNVAPATWQGFRPLTSK